MADKEKSKKVKVRRSKHKSTKQKEVDEWDSYSKDKKKDTKKHKHKKSQKRKEKTPEPKEKVNPTKQFRRQKSHRDKDKKSKRRDSKLRKVSAAAIDDSDGFGEIKNKAKIAVKHKNKRDSGFGKLQTTQKLDFDDNADMGGSDISFTAKKDHKFQEMEKAKTIKKQREIRAQKALEKQKEAEKLKQKKERKHKSRKRGLSKGYKNDGKEVTEDKPERQETNEEKKARKQREKQERLERLKNLRMKHEDEQKKSQQEMMEFVAKRDEKRYFYAFDAYPKDKQKPKQLIYKSLRPLQPLCHIKSFRYDPNNKNVEPILNAYGFTVTHMDCVVSYYLIDIKWKEIITKEVYIGAVKKLLRQEWTNEKIESIWTHLLQSKQITAQIHTQYVSDKKTEMSENKTDLESDMSYNYKGGQYTNALTIVDFINGLDLCRKSNDKFSSDVYEFYYLLLGGHFYKDTLAEEDDWNGKVTQRVLWLKQFGEKAKFLYGIENGQSFVGACHGLQEYRAIICSLLNVDFIPPSDKHSGEIVSKIKDFIHETVGNIKIFQYEWFQQEVLTGAAKLCVLRSDLMYSSMKIIQIILKECDRLLTMLESKVLVQSAMHLMKVVIIYCPIKQQDLLLKELSSLISGTQYKHRSFVPLQQLLLLLLVAIDRYNIQNSKTWQKIAAVPVFACSHQRQEISDCGEEVLWRIYTFSPSVGEDILSNKMEKKKAKHVRKRMGIEKYWETQQKQKANMQTLKIYQDTDTIPNQWKKLTYNPALNEMSPARLWTMMQKVVFGEIDLLDEYPSLDYNDFVNGLSKCQTYLREASVRAMFQCLPRKHRPFVTKQEFVNFICMAHVAPNRRHYSLRIKECLTIIEDKWKTDEANKKKIAQQKQIEREQARLKRKQEREEKKRRKKEEQRQKELARKDREQKRKEKELNAQNAEREQKAEAQRKIEEEERRLEQIEIEKLQRQMEIAKDTEKEEQKRLKKEEKDRKRKARREDRQRKREAKKRMKGKVPQLDTSRALSEDKEQQIIREDITPKFTPKRKHEHTKTKTREEEVWQDMVALLDLGDGDDEDMYGEFKQDKSRGSDEESVASLSHTFVGAPKTPYFGKRSSVTSVTSINTPTFANWGDKSVGFDLRSMPSKTPKRSDHSSHMSQVSWGVNADLDSVLGDLNMPPMRDDGIQNNLDDDSNDEEHKLKRKKKLCGVSIQKIMKLSRDDVYEQRSVILFDETALSVAFKKKMGKEFCLNAAATKLIFVAGLQDKGLELDNEQLNIVHYGVQQFQEETEYDLPSAVARWIVTDETKEDRTSRTLTDYEQWNRVKKKLPTFLKHEIVAFIFGETYFSLSDDKSDKNNKKRKRKKGEVVIHRNTNYIGSCVGELHDVNLPKPKYSGVINGFMLESHKEFYDLQSDMSLELVHCISFYMPLSENPPDESGKLEIKSLVLDSTYHPQKMSANEGYNEYDSLRINRTGRLTTIPFENDTGKGGVLLVRVYGEMFIERHATVDADSCGYLGGWQYQCQGDSLYKCGKTGRYSNLGGGGGGFYGGGGGYGSRGTTPKSDYASVFKPGEGGRYYGDRFVHLQAFMGSGGGSGGGKYLFSRGGRGGGVVVIVAGSIHNKGRIMSLSQRGRYLAGSGSGGSIVIECNSYYHYGKGAILASSLEPYTDISDKKLSGGIGGCGRVALRINRQKWTTEMRKAICTNDASKIWTPSPWIYPIPKWVSPDKFNNCESGYLEPKLIGFHTMSRIEDSVYKNCTLFRNDGVDPLTGNDGDGPMINNFCHYGKTEKRDMEIYLKRKEKEREKLYNWKFEEFALEKDKSKRGSKDKHKPGLKKRKSQYIAYGSSKNLFIGTKT